MTHSFHPEAEAEIIQATDYYEDCADGFGHEFAIEVYSTIERIGAHPEAWPILEGEVRRCLVRRFPYGILYALDEGRILVLAVMHLHREPHY